MKEICVPYDEIRYQHLNYSLRSVANWALGKGDPLGYDLHDEPKTGEKLCGFFLPPFQRPEVWDTERKIKLIESLFCNINIGSMMFVSNFQNPEVDGWLIDGQQRLSAIRDFVFGKFGVFDDSLYFEELETTNLVFNSTYGRNRKPQNAKIAFRGVYLDFNRIDDISDPKILMQIYERLNFGGMPHTEDQRPSFS